MNKKELWLTLKNYHFEHVVPVDLWSQIEHVFGGPDASTRAFAAKIAKKHGWRKQFALQAVFEYKKFVYLGIVSDFIVTPSSIIDIVWHEHILFSRAYRSFCDEVIHYNFDHHPELLVLEDQTAQFNAQYMNTIELYKEEFAMEPPPWIWGLTKYDPETAKTGNPAKKKKAAAVSNDGSSGDTGYSAEGPLCSMFDADGDGGSAEFGGFDGGSGGGSGADGGWGDSGSSSDSGDSGGGDGGGCSGGCGGGD
jgi:hypothetical protein